MLILAVTGLVVICALTLYKVFRVLNAKERRILAGARRAEKITDSAHKFIIDRIVDLRRPLQGLVGIRDLYSESQSPQDAKDYFNIANHCSKFVIYQLERIQFYSELENGSIRFDRQDFSIKDCLNEALSICKEQVKDAHTNIVQDVSPNASEYMIGHKVALQRILVELIDNSIRHGGLGSISIKILPDPTHKEQIRFIIRDTGPGLSDKTLSYLRSHLPAHKKAMPWAETKSGFGLIIVKRIIHTLGGELTVDSQKGSGTTISFVFPEHVLSASTNPLKAKEYTPKTGLKVLVVDDEAISRQVVVSLLKKLGLAADTAENGRDAILKQKQNKYDLIFMDLTMPILDGYEASRVILSELNTGKRVQIVVLSSRSTQAEIDRCMAIGVSDFLAKPAGLEHLRQSLIKIGGLNTVVYSENDILANLEEKNVVSLDLARRKKFKTKPKEPGYYINFNALFNSLDENLVRCQEVLQKVSLDIGVDLAKISNAVNGNDRKEIILILQKLNDDFSLILCSQGLEVVQKMQTAVRAEGSEGLLISLKEMSEIFANIRAEIDRLINMNSAAS